jgi:hypothetical protein
VLNSLVKPSHGCFDPFRCPQSARHHARPSWGRFVGPLPRCLAPPNRRPAIFRIARNGVTDASLGTTFIYTNAARSHSR